MAQAVLEPKPGHTETFHVEMTWGDAIKIPSDADGGAVMAGYVSLSWLGRLEAVEHDLDCVRAAESALDTFFVE